MPNPTTELWLDSETEAMVALGESLTEHLLLKIRAVRRPEDLVPIQEAIMDAYASMKVGKRSCGVEVKVGWNQIGEFGSPDLFLWPTIEPVRRLVEHGFDHEKMAHEVQTNDGVTIGTKGQLWLPGNVSPDQHKHH
jgi:hypothetical protein